MTKIFGVYVTYKNGGKIISGPFLTKNSANKAMLKMIQFSRAFDAGTDSEIIHANIVERGDDDQSLLPNQLAPAKCSVPSRNSRAS